MSGIALLLFLSSLSACSPGVISGGGDADLPWRRDADECRGSGCSDSGTDPCDNRMCLPGQTCVDGLCQTIDLCDGVDCDVDGEVCDPRDGSCRPGEVDDDGDGVTISGGDCDDGDPLIHPGAEEMCDGVDQDCDRAVDDGFPDVDGDGYDICGGGVPGAEDCDDANTLRYPGRVEDCDGLDNDCDDEIDEEIAPRACTTACGDGTERCEGGIWICSAPGSCECLPDDPFDEEPCGRCGSRQRSCGEDLRWGEWSACEGEGTCMGGEVQTRPCRRCGTQARSCNETCSWGDYGDCVDQGDCEVGAEEICATSCGSHGSRRCDALCGWGDCSPPVETCNGSDDDCDGDCDEGCRHPIHRSYNEGAGDHFYTTDVGEAGCCGYSIESRDYFYLYSSPVAGTALFWRCFNASAGDHFYTLDAGCEGVRGAIQEGNIGSIAMEDFCGAVPLYRLSRSSGDHFYTIDAAERDRVTTLGYVFEEIAGYVWRTP